MYSTAADRDHEKKFLAARNFSNTSSIVEARVVCKLQGLTGKEMEQLSDDVKMHFDLYRKRQVNVKYLEVHVFISSRVHYKIRIVLNSSRQGPQLHYFDTRSVIFFIWKNLGTFC